MENCLAPSPSGIVDMASQPPCKKRFTQQILRVNRAVPIWKRAHIPEPKIPEASQGHGGVEKDSNLELLWYEGDVLPQELADIAEVTSDRDYDSFDDRAWSRE